MGKLVDGGEQIQAKQERDWNVYTVAAPRESPGDYQHIN